MSYTCNFSSYPPSNSALHWRGTSASIPFLYQFEFCIHSHFFTFSLTLLSLPSFFPWMASLRTSKRWKAPRSGLCGGWRRRVHFSFFNCFLCFQMFGCALCWRKVSAKFLWGWTLLKHFCKVLRFWMYRSQLRVWPCGVISTTITPSSSLKQWP